MIISLLPSAVKPHDFKGFFVPILFTRVSANLADLACSLSRVLGGMSYGSFSEVESVPRLSAGLGGLKWYVCDTLSVMIATPSCGGGCFMSGSMIFQDPSENGCTELSSP